MSPHSRLDPSLVNFALEPGLSVTEFLDVLVRSTLGERRPIDDRARLEGMLRHADVIVTARNRQGILIGIARAITDFHYCTYLSDLAVDVAYQKQGIGQELIRRCHEAAGRRTTLILLSAPAAREYYPHIGLERHDSCWLQRPPSSGDPPQRSGDPSDSLKEAGSPPQELN